MVAHLCGVPIVPGLLCVRIQKFSISFFVFPHFLESRQFDTGFVFVLRS